MNADATGGAAGEGGGERPVWLPENHPPHQWPIGCVSGWRIGYGCPTIWCKGEGPQRVEADS